MLTRLAIAAFFAITPISSQAQVPLAVKGQWEYNDASGMETDEGLSICFQVDAASAARSPQLQQAGGAFCLSNPSEAARLLGVSRTSPKSGCRYVAKGTASVGLTNVRLLPEDEMYDERVEARLTVVRANQLTSPLGSNCARSAVASKGFASIYDAIDTLGTHPVYRETSASDFVRIDTSSGFAELDASTQMWLPSGSSNTLVTYYEGNSGLHELSVYRYEGGHWHDVSKDALPGYTENSRQFNGTNFYLESRGGKPVMRSLPGKKAWRFSGDRFIPEV